MSGGGNQLFGIYGYDGQDIGQRYYNVSDGNAYGATGFQASDGGDVGYKLCRAGTRNIFTMTIGHHRGSPAAFGYSSSLGIGSLSPNILQGYTIAEFREYGDDSSDYLLLSGYVCPWSKIIIQVIGEAFTREVVANGRYYTGGGLPFSSYFWSNNKTIQFKLTPA